MLVAVLDDSESLCLLPPNVKPLSVSLDQLCFNDGPHGVSSHVNDSVIKLEPVKISFADLNLPVHEAFLNQLSRLQLIIDLFDLALVLELLHLTHGESDVLFVCDHTCMKNLLEDERF